MGYARKDVENKENSKEICTLSRRGRALQYWTDKVSGVGERSQSSV